MLFHSPTFLLFFLVFLAGLLVIKGESRVIYVTAASYIFYAWWYPPYIVVPLGLTLYAHHFSHRAPSSPMAFGLAVSGALLPLVIFKYTGFITSNIADLLGMDMAFKPAWALPLGISFISFTAVAYIADVRARRIQPEKNFWVTALFFSFFPHLIAGPIVRAHEIVEQIKSIRINRDALNLALLLFAIGAVKKVGVADQIAPYVDRLYSSDSLVTWPEAVLVFYGFTVQIYCDFSGYTDMALALAVLLNVKMPENFNRPYLATSISDFWRRWHITLSRWLRDYLYIALGGNRHGPARMLTALLVTMLLGGLWHGAAWTFVLWGGLHGALLAIERLADLFGRAHLPTLPRPLAMAITLHLVALGWIFFRAPNVSRAFDVIAGFAQPGDIGILATNIFYIVLIMLVLSLHPFDTFAKVSNLADRLPLPIVAPLSIMLILTCAALSVGNPSAFIYFDF